MATNSIKINTVKNSFKAALEKAEFTWTSAAEPTGFADVYTGIILDKEKQGSPWLCIVDAPPEITNKGLQASFYGKNTPLRFYICADYEKLGIEEAERRVVEAYEALESFLCNAQKMTEVGLPSYEYIGWEAFKTEDLLIRGRILTLQTISKVAML